MIKFAVSFGGAYDKEDIRSALSGDCQAPHMQSKGGADSCFIMDIGKIFECLNEDYRNIVLSIAIGFPVAYVDCWKLQPLFKTYDMIPQILLALGVSVIFVFLGIGFCIFTWVMIEKLIKTSLKWKFNIFLTLVPFFVISLFILSGSITTKEEVKIFFLAFVLFVFVVNFIAYKFYYRNRNRSTEHTN